MTVMDETYRISPRVLLQRGDKIRLSGGPRYRAGSGRLIRLKNVVNGDCEFFGFVTDGVGNECIHVKQCGCLSVIVIKRITMTDDQIVDNPYKIRKKRT